MHYVSALVRIASVEVCVRRTVHVALFSLTSLSLFSAGVLLQTLCDQASRTGETGYYLASFEGAITHIQELDLTLDRKEHVNNQ